jgi:hypothetical protein
VCGCVCGCVWVCVCVGVCVCVYRGGTGARCSSGGWAASARRGRRRVRTPRRADAGAPRQGEGRRRTSRRRPCRMIFTGAAGCGGGAGAARWGGGGGCTQIAAPAPAPPLRRPPQKVYVAGVLFHTPPPTCEVVARIVGPNARDARAGRSSRATRCGPAADGAAERAREASIMKGREERSWRGSKASARASGVSQITARRCDNGRLPNGAK